MFPCGRRLKGVSFTGLVIIAAIACAAPNAAQAEAGPQDRGYYAMKPPAASIAGLTSRMQPVILPLDEGYYRYSMGSYAPHSAGSVDDDYQASHPYPPHVFAMPENSAAAPEWDAYDDWGGWQEYVERPGRFPW